jgi:uncharacterized protein with PIN domain
MGIIKEEEIAGYHLNTDASVVCKGCITAEEVSAITEEEIIPQKEVDDSDDFYFCNRCKKLL